MENQGQREMKKVFETLFNLGCETCTEILKNNYQSFYDLKKQDIKNIIEHIKKCDKLINLPMNQNHKEKYKQDREYIKNLVNDYCITFHYVFLGIE